MTVAAQYEHCENDKSLLNNTHKNPCGIYINHIVQQFSNMIGVSLLHILHSRNARFAIYIKNK